MGDIGHRLLEIIPGEENIEKSGFSPPAALLRVFRAEPNI
jgi:hypothetical protein